MTIGITVTGDAILGYVLTVTDADQGDYVHVYRVDQSGHYEDAIVRDLDMATPTGSTMVVIDYEAPFNLDLKYHAQAFASSDLVTPVGSAISGIVGTTVPSGFSIIIDPLAAGERVAISLEEIIPWEYPAKVLGTHNVLRRRNSVVHTDVEGGRMGNLAGTNLDMDEVDWDDSGPRLPYEVNDHPNWDTMFMPGTTLYFRNTWSESSFNDMYFKVTGNRKVEPLESVGRNAGQMLKRFSFDYTEQDRPDTSLTGLGLGNWAQVNAANADWAEVLSKHANWASVLVNPRL